MTTTESMTIGVFARSTGLTPGALRFYADSKLLEPAAVDGSSGYRYYTESQVDVAVRIRLLRGIGMSLNDIAAVIAGDLTALARHVAQLADDARRAQRIARDIAEKTALETRERQLMITVNGPVFATAVDQILTATSRHPEMPVLDGVYLESSGGTLIITATDRYRLSTRSVAVEGVDDEWSAVVDGDDLRAALSFVRSRHRVQLGVRGTGVDFHAEGSSAMRCRVLAEEFPDYRAMLDALPAAETRVVAQRAALVRALEGHDEQFSSLRVAGGALTLSGTRIPATVTGPDIDMAFSITTLYPAVASAVGHEVMIDIGGPSMPVVVRSADYGDLTTLAMPVEPNAVGR
ncbi:DNA polymerase III subunit beta family protein [Rhodococcoides yunnanense]|uniref:DNA polymerase III subunit beta family protein n=1 Tax=Rhodococcoides yunnanense TaxID=278209 RepID=UPI000933BE85|nr:MerR family transcriptional regulator [Rhodococcus yunnanensis]